VTRRELDEVHKAFEMTGGNMPAAAAALDITYDDLKQRILNNQELKTRWWGKSGTAPRKEDEETVSEAGALIEAPPAPNSAKLTKDDTYAVSVVVREDALLRKGFKRLNLTKDEAKMAVELANLGRQHAGAQVNIATAGSTRIGVITQGLVDKERRMLDDLYQQIQEAEAANELEKAVLLREERHRTIRNINDLSNSIARHADVTQKTVMLYAMVRASQRSKPNSKPGFAEEEAKDANPS
jgi:hypothetical protein